MERGEARCVPAASRSCNGAEPVQPEDSHAFDGKRGWMPADFFRSGRTADSWNGSFGKTGERKESAAGKSGGFLFSRGRGQGGTQCPLSGVPGVKHPARVKGGRPLSGCRGEASCSGSRAESPAQQGCCLRQPVLGITCRKCLTKTPGSRGRSI